MMLRTSAGIAVAALVWFAVNLLVPVGPRVLLWLPTVAAGVVSLLALRRTASLPALPAPTRRFWWHMTAVVALITLAVSVQAADVLTAADPRGSHTGNLMLSLSGPAVLIIIYALYRLPLDPRTPGEVTRVVLDAGTVALSATLFIWHFSPTLGSGVGTAVSLLLTVLSLLALFAVSKVILSSHMHVSGPALRLLAAAIFVGALAPLVRPVLERIDPTLFPGMVVYPAIFLCAAWAAEHQRAEAVPARRRGVQPARRRSFSALPYVAVAAVDALLVHVTLGEAADETIVVAAAVTLTAIVVLRQLIAFRDNNRLLQRLDHGATHDALTQLPNRALFQTRLQKALTAPGDRPVAVALIDLDDFKEVNDTLGHEVGDQLLIGVAQRLEGCIRAEDTVARLGGDEFVVVLDDADPQAADLAAERMSNALRQPVYADGHELPIRASIGIADGRSGDEASVLLRHADIAMYAAKKLAGTAYLHYEAGMANTGTAHAHLGAELRDALAAGEFFLLYQPIVDLVDGRVTGTEALVRWAHPVRGTLAPDAFIPVAERTGLIVPLGALVMRTAFAQLAAWIAEHGDAAPRSLNVNVSARDLREPGFAETVAALLAEHDLPADRVVLEITETMALEPGLSVTNLHRLRALGVRISLDDFGTGHSTLSMLHECPIDEIKLDRSFTQAEPDDRVPMSAAVIHLAQVLGLHAVAEGVETAEQAEMLLAQGYIAAQGYHFARPMTPEMLGDLLRSGAGLPGTPVGMSRA
ncbi:putative bifunctional diguanylate cyclase/phosphodiesterase [Symbioplanes lichenis]|uniref:putative bifunctional diguanylate cyclase/phosphodiesterase n=1 Tax=Symbioplanes lichenis TaxID=1629072 RepID=UPI0027389B9B|nr:bifunctional diguanylate cyclase/phosphodiesterase [Actinoplanes lichenis]